MRAIPISLTISFLALAAAAPVAANDVLQWNEKTMKVIEANAW